MYSNGFDDYDYQKSVGLLPEKKEPEYEDDRMSHVPDHIRLTGRLRQKDKNPPPDNWVPADEYVTTVCEICGKDISSHKTDAGICYECWRREHLKYRADMPVDPVFQHYWKKNPTRWGGKHD